MAVNPDTLDLLTGRAMMDDAFRADLTSSVQATRRATVAAFYASIGVPLSTADRDTLADNVSAAVVGMNAGGVFVGGTAT